MMMMIVVVVMSMVGITHGVGNGTQGHPTTVTDSIATGGTNNTADDLINMGTRRTHYDEWEESCWVE